MSAWFMELMEWMLASCLAGHFILSALFQWPRFQQGRLARLAIPLALPCWTFFAPRPGTSDYRLLARVSDGSTVAAWREVDMGWPRSRVTRALWNPEKTGHKALSDCVQALMATSVELPERDRWQQFVSKPYVTILSYLLERTAPALGCRIEFAIVETTGFGALRTLDPIFVSQRHKVS